MRVYVKIPQKRVLNSKEESFANHLLTKGV